MVDSAPNKESSLHHPGPSLVVTAWENAHGQLLKENAFRGLGLPVLATGREIAKRAEEFRVARELETDVPRWAFAPEQLLNMDRTRAALQALNDPFRRVLGEIFWYWPSSYPQTGSDEALTWLAQDEPSRAVALWVERQETGDVTAFHNLAVYHLMMALDLEPTVNGGPVDELNGWWEAAIRFWQLTAERDEFWRRIETRVVDLSDLQMKPESVGLLRGVFSDVLGGIVGSLALKAVETNQARTASRHVVLLGRIYENREKLDAALARSVRTVVRRVDTQIADAYRALEEGKGEGGTIARTLVEHCSQDIHSLNTLCGPDSAVAGSAVTELCQLILEALAVNTGAMVNPADTLVTLAYAQSLRAPADVGRRIRDFYKQSVTQAVRNSVAANASDPSYARLYSVVVEEMLVAWNQWDLPPPVRHKVADEIAEQLREIARQALAERDDIAFALHAHDLLLQLPCEAAEAARRQNERDQVQRDFDNRRSHALRLGAMGTLFVLDHRGLQWNEQTWPIDQVSALRWGTYSTKDTKERRKIVAIRVGKAELFIDERNFFGGEDAADVYARLVLALEFFAVPVLVTHIVEEIRKGGALQFDELTVTRDEVLVHSAVSLRSQPQSIPLRELQHRTESDAWSVSSGAWKRKYLIVETWNAVIMGRVIAALTEEADLSSSHE
jgi:hypothetical protein